MQTQHNTVIDGPVVDANSLQQRLEEAGRTLLALPNSGPSTRLAQPGIEWVRDAAEQYGRHPAKLRPATPDSAQISRMNEALAWISLIPQDKYVLRRIIGARSLVHPMTDRYLFSWRRLGVAIGADHKAVRRWHAQGIDLILKALRGRSAPAIGRSAAAGGIGDPRPVRAQPRPGPAVDGRS